MSTRLSLNVRDTGQTDQRQEFLHLSLYLAEY